MGLYAQKNEDVFQHQVPFNLPFNMCNNTTQSILNEKQIFSESIHMYFQLSRLESIHQVKTLKIYGLYQKFNDRTFKCKYYKISFKRYIFDYELDVKNSKKLYASILLTSHDFA